MAIHSIKTSCHFRYLYPKDYKGSCNTVIEHAKHKDNYDLLQPIVDLRKKYLVKILPGRAILKAFLNIL